MSSNRRILRVASKNGFINVVDTHDNILRHVGSTVPRNLHPALLVERIRIPTVYLSGRADDEDSKFQFQVIPHLFQEDRVVILEHDGGHEVPRACLDIQRTVDALGWAIEESKMLSF